MNIPSHRTTLPLRINQHCNQYHVNSKPNSICMYTYTITTKCQTTTKPYPSSRCVHIPLPPLQAQGAKIFTKTEVKKIRSTPPSQTHKHIHNNTDTQKHIHRHTHTHTHTNTTRGGAIMNWTVGNPLSYIRIHVRGNFICDQSGSPARKSLAAAAVSIMLNLTGVAELNFNFHVKTCFLWHRM